MTEELLDAGRAVDYRLGADPDTDVYVLPLADLGDVRGWHVPARVVIDASRDETPSLPVLAQIVLLRRRLRAAGGDLVIAAAPKTAELLRQNGLHWAIPCCDDLSSARAAVRPASGAGMGRPAPSAQLARDGAGGFPHGVTRRGLDRPRP